MLSIKLENKRSNHLPISLSPSTSKLDVDQLSLLAIAAPKNAVRIAPVINAKIMGNHSITTLLVGFKTELTVALWEGFWFNRCHHFSRLTGVITP
jgi:hypothetical protein